ncbi:4-hydroxythreonine-4-phosphate dehydrogenase PdxA [Corticibacterium sp. UT-5YL-CI-8]|nr:4-hydroxythreonine-4-phosphate dehydrogenase PdxA [Tianweitania sp. UT-5YL-CI-8]
MRSATAEILQDRIVIGLVTGDPAGVGAELTVRMLTDHSLVESTQLVVIGSRRVLAHAAALCKTVVDLPVLPLEDLTRQKLEAMAGHVFVETRTDGELGKLACGEATAAGGAFALANFRIGIDLTNRQLLDALSFGPFNKYAMRLAYAPYEDEIAFISSALDSGNGVAEFNVADIWTGRVTSHVPLSEVASLITREAVLRRLVLTDRLMRAGGVAAPRIAVAGLNPHAGDNGNFGREEIDVIEPAVHEGRRLGIDCDGPFSADTVFIRASKGDYNAVLTMYHDQGQIAMKLMNFDRGVVLFGGFPFPVCTPAHGTAYDIAGQGIASPGAMRAAITLAAKMVREARRATKEGSNAATFNASKQEPVTNIEEVS